MSLVPSFGSLPSSFALPFPVWGVSGKSLFVNVTFPPVTTFSPLTPGNVTFVPSGTPLTVTSTWPSVGSWLPTVNVGVPLGTNFLGICLSSLVSAGSFVPSVTVTFPVWTVSFSWSFLIVIVPSLTLNVPSIPGTVTTESSG